MHPATARSIRAAEVCQRFALSEAAQPYPPGDKPVPEYLVLLGGKDCYRDAAFLAACALPTREAVWWGCLCVWHLVRPQPSPEADAALRTAFTWVNAPTEPHRRAAEKAADRAGTNAAGLLARAVFCSSGSLSAANLPAVKPPPYLGHHLVAGAVLLAASAGPPEQTRERWAHILQWAADVAEGKNRWS